MLERYGWSDALQLQFDIHATQGLSPGRVIVQQRGRYRLITAEGELEATLSGKFAHEAQEGGFPVAGDWVAAATRPQDGTATIHLVLPRTSAFVRRASGPGGGAQVVAANADLAFIVTSLNAELSLRRIERYLAAAWESGAQPVIVLTKADLADNSASALAEVEAVSPGVSVHVVSALSGEGVDGLSRHLTNGKTAVLLGSSGVGKSTLVNALAGNELMATRAIREDDARGRHTTTHRELVLLPGGGLVLDTPGMREIGLWDSADGLSAAFADIEELGQQCKFGDCAHRSEPGCAIAAALAGGTLDAARWHNYLKLQRELAFEVRKEDPRARAEARKVWIQRAKASRAGNKRKWREE